MGKISPHFVKIFIFCMIGVICIGIGAGLLQRVSCFGKNVNMICQIDFISASRAREIRQLEAEKENPVSFTVWTQKEGLSISDAAGYHSTVTNVIEMNGTSENLIPYGKFLQEDDTEGCLIGEVTARNLFGSTDVTGMSLIYGERELKIRGILKEPSDILLVESQGAAFFDRITLQKQQGITKSMQKERFCESYGITARLLWFDFFSFDFFRSLVPSKWSDFEGWSRNLSTLSQTVCFALFSEKSSLDIVYLKLQAAGFLFLLLGDGIFLWIFRKIKSGGKASKIFSDF